MSRNDYGLGGTLRLHETLEQEVHGLPPNEFRINTDSCQGRHQILGQLYVVETDD